MGVGVIVYVRESCSAGRREGAEVDMVKVLKLDEVGWQGKKASGQVGNTRFSAVPSKSKLRIFTFHILRDAMEAVRSLHDDRKTKA